MNTNKTLSFCLIFFSILLFTNCKITKPAEIPTQPPTVSAPPPASAQQPKKDDWEKELKLSFRKHYRQAVKTRTVEIRKEYPIILNDFLNMTLLRPNGERVRFRMKKTVYNTLAHATHPPMTVFAILNASNFEVNNDSTLQKLMVYDTLLTKSISGILLTTHLEEKQLTRTAFIMKETQNYLQRVIENKKTSLPEFEDFIKKIETPIQENLMDSAKEHLEQFKTQMEEWRKEFPDEKWEEVRVLVYGFHQPRILNVADQFFRWLLKEPKFENHVVYAEFQFSIFGQNRKKAEALAIELLTKVDLDKKAARYLLGEKTLLQQDIMGPVTEKLISGWGESNWINEK